MRPQFDERDGAILAERVAARDARPGPRVGDWVRMLDGTLRRFTHNWGDGLQTTYKWHDTGSINNSDGFHLCENGGTSFSGSLDDTIPLAELEDTGSRMDGCFWFFHHNEWKAHNGVYIHTPCRVFKQIPRAGVSYFGCDNCGGQFPDVRLYPQGGGGNDILCYICWIAANKHRRLSGIHYGRPEEWPQVNWFTAKQYGADQ